MKSDATIARLMGTVKIIGFVLFVALLQSGCATGGNHAEMPPSPPSEEIRAQAGSLGVVTAGALTNLALLQRTPGLGMAASTGAGAGGGALAGVEAAHGAPLALIITVPLGALGGALVGASVGHSEQKSAQLARAQQEQLWKIPALTNLQDTVSREVYRAVQRKTHHCVVYIPEGEPARTGSGAAHPSLASNALDTLIEVNVFEAGLIAHWEQESPRLGAFMSVRIRLIRVRDGAELYARTWLYRGGSREFEYWMQGNGLRLRQQLSLLAPQLAESVTEELFLVYEPPRRKTASASKNP